MGLVWKLQDVSGPGWVREITPDGQPIATASVWEAAEWTDYHEAQRAARRLNRLPRKRPVRPVLVAATPGGARLLPPGDVREIKAAVARRARQRPRSSPDH